jgi:uncharacterized protein YaeQ
MFSQEMTSTIASCRLWCREGDSLLEFEIELGTPYKNREKWFCDWAIGDIILFAKSPFVKSEIFTCTVFLVV